MARLGGDEFAVIIAELDSVAAIEALAERIILALHNPIELTAGPVTMGVSIGIALFPTDSDDPEQLVRCADQAMYCAKQQEKNRYCLDDAQSQGGSNDIG